MIAHEPLATVVIATRNRKEDLYKAIRSALQQSIALQVVVIDDGSTDGTIDMLRERFPQVIASRSDHSHGYIVQRNCGARLATTRFVFSIDDDAVFSTPQVVEQTLADFGDPRVGAVAIPFVEPQKGNDVRQRAPSSDRIWITDSFVGTAHALRRDVFVQMNGYREMLVHQGEERDLCIRMLDRGWFTRLGTSDPIIHCESPRRDFRRMDYFGRRNDILFAWHNAPLEWLPVHLAATSLNGARAACKSRRFYDMLAGTVAGYLCCLKYRSERAPVSRLAYSTARSLRKHGASPIEDMCAVAVEEDASRQANR